MSEERTYTAFVGQRCLASGVLRSVLTRAKQHVDEKSGDGLLVFDDETGRQVEFDWRGSLDEMLDREAPAKRAGPGRPKLGVVSREISLLPRQWEWLEAQPQGISAALRRLVDDARKREPDKERLRKATEATSKFMWAMAGNLPGFEEATRALFAGDRARLDAMIASWPIDIRTHVVRMLGAEAAQPK